MRERVNLGNLADKHQRELQQRRVNRWVKAEKQRTTQVSHQMNQGTVEISPSQSISEAELLRRKRESEEAERMWNRELEFNKVKRPLTEEEKQEASMLRQKRQERDSFLTHQSDSLLTFDEFTQDSGGIPMFDNYDVFRFVGRKGMRGEIGEKFQLQNPELMEQIRDAYEKIVPVAENIEQQRRKGEFHPTRYSYLNDRGHALVPSHQLIYETYTTLHAQLTEDERRRLGLVRKDGKALGVNFLLFSTNW